MELPYSSGSNWPCLESDPCGSPGESWRFEILFTPLIRVSEPLAHSWEIEPVRLSPSGGLEENLFAVRGYRPLWYGGFSRFIDRDA